MAADDERGLDRQPQDVPYSLSSVRAEIVEGLTFDEWLKVGDRLLALREASAWWIGDWLVYGEWRFGEKYRVVVERLGLSYDRVRDYAYVAGRIGPGVRRRELPFTHHRLVAKLDPAEQHEWLARASVQRWTKRELAEALSHASKTAGRPADLQVVKVTAAREQVEAWQEAALGDGVNLSQWIARTLDENLVGRRPAE